MRRLGIGDLIAFAGTFILFVSLFMPWYSLTFSFSSLNTTSLAGISALGDGAGGWRFLILAVCLILMVYLFLRTMISRSTRRMPLPHWQLLTALCSLNLLLAALAFFVRPGDGTVVVGLSIGWDYGAFLGLSAAALALVGAVIRRGEPEMRDPGTPYRSEQAPTVGIAAQAADPPAYAASPVDPSPYDPAPNDRSPASTRTHTRTGSRSLTHHHR